MKKPKTIFRWQFIVLILPLLFILLFLILSTAASGAKLLPSNNPADLTARERLDTTQVMASFENGAGINFCTAYPIYDWRAYTDYFCPLSGIYQRFGQALVCPRSDWGLLALKFNLTNYQSEWELEPRLIFDCGPSYLAFCGSLSLGQITSSQFGLRVKVLSVSGFLRTDNFFSEQPAYYAAGLTYQGLLNLEIAHEFNPEQPVSYLRVSFNGLPEIEGSSLCPGICLLWNPDIELGFVIAISLNPDFTSTPGPPKESAW